MNDLLARSFALFNLFVYLFTCQVSVCVFVLSCIPFVGFIHSVVSFVSFCGEARSRERFACLFVRIIWCLPVGVFVYVLVRLSVCLLAYLLVHSFNYVRTFVCSAYFVCLFVRLRIRLFIVC